MDWQRRPTQWPSSSPDPTPLDFLFWEQVKNEFESKQNLHLNPLKERIIASVASISSSEILANTYEEVNFRLDLCRATNVALIVFYCTKLKKTREY